ncbi:hypothetical protein O6H91_21G048000 [Diphasiastrum complanatum]|uniref:Uncharacterized protein n=1 Tax=Diphasiastrum complanatum TaxID=34168 RepID=A0ACC2AKH9_DIPCM|nr:hypothetical protein O6H91_Y265500 [Diphasiastrum complanatum]KAJ7294332.1 hypothetical protein O6H91_Y265500 [Diphasiastrum complanatum]KAJ7517955.1 hypothetical protein O6H91_21G048000 [Diphasiastrum complanatum]
MTTQVHYHYHFPAGCTVPAEDVDGKLVRILSKANPDYYLTALADGRVVLNPENSIDPRQQWIKDESWGLKLEDAAGFPAFALVNIATGRALHHGNHENEQVTSTVYDKDHLDDDILWSTSQDFGNGYRTIRMYNNICLNLDADHGDKKHGGIKNGNKLILYRWLKNHDNQFWKIVPV